MDEATYIGATDSVGHIENIGRFEYYLDAAGDLWGAPLDNVIDVRTGYRIGRWEAPAHMADLRMSQIRQAPSISAATR